MRILFVKPPNYTFMDEEIVRHIPIGLCYLASACRKHNHEVLIFDSLAYLEDSHIVDMDSISLKQRTKLLHHPLWKQLTHCGASWERLEQCIESFNPDIIGVSIMFSTFYDVAYDLIHRIKTSYSGITVVAGGVHATTQYQHVLSHTDVDFVLMGEGEESFPKLLEYIQKNQRPYDVGGIAFCEENLRYINESIPNGKTIYVNNQKHFVKNLDSLEYPAIDLLDIDRYNGYYTLITSRGCPFSCAFCTVHPIAGKEFRARSPEHVVAEIERCVNEFHITKFNIEDDNFTYDLNRVIQILDMIIEKKLNIDLFLPNGMTVIGISEELADKMVRAGLKYVFFGLETTSPKILKMISKNFTSLEKVKKIMAWFKNRECIAKASLILGMSNQTLEDMAIDIVNLIKNDISFICNIFYPVPGSKLYKDCIENGILSKDFDFTWLTSYNIPISTKNFTRQDILDFFMIAKLYNDYNINFQYDKTSNTLEQLMWDLGVTRNVTFHNETITYSYKNTDSSVLKLNNEILFVEMISVLIYIYMKKPYSIIKRKWNSMELGIKSVIYCSDESRRSRAIDTFIDIIAQWDLYVNEAVE